jgi:cytochrome c-type biogenesis protein CcmH/NrfG
MERMSRLLLFALKACALAPGDPHTLDALGMAYAEVGDFTQAQAAASNALQLATARKVLDLTLWRRRLEFYRTSQPWRESFRATSAPP